MAIVFIPKPHLSENGPLTPIHTHILLKRQYLFHPENSIFRLDSKWLYHYK